MMSYFVEMMDLHARKKINPEIKEMFIADSGSTSHMVDSLTNTTNLQEVKTVLKKGKTKR